MNTAPTTYVIRVHGHLDDHWSAWLGGLDMTRQDDGNTTFTVVADQAQLHALLAAIRDIGAVLMDLRSNNDIAPGQREEHRRTRNHVQHDPYDGERHQT